MDGVIGNKKETLEAWGVAILAHLEEVQII